MSECVCVCGGGGVSVCVWGGRYGLNTNIIIIPVQ